MERLIDSLNQWGEPLLTEQLLVRANYWIVDSLVATDYYTLMEKGIFSYDQRDLRILKKGDTLFVPGPDQIISLQEKINETRLDLNIPEFRLRIIEKEEVLYSLLVRVGRNSARYLELIHRIEDNRTKVGQGKIVRVEKNPTFIDPETAKRYKLTNRDDGKRTRTPLIPWLEPEINGQRHGQLIHPTTNPKTLGKAYSNGCIGLSEGDAWRVYYHAPVGTRIKIRYDLEIENAEQQIISLPDIYHKFTMPQKTPEIN
jgi:L,D-transpeptidase ErfK/SrfK